MRRKGMMKGKGRGYKNVIGKDPMVHSQSARGIKQPQRVSEMTFKQLQKKGIFLKYQADSDGDGVVNIKDCRPLNKDKQDNGLIKKAGKYFKKKIAEKEKQQKDEKISSLEKTDFSLGRQHLKQKERVEGLRNQLKREKDSDKQDKLNEELSLEEEQLREIEEKLTEVRVEDLDDNQLKKLAIRYKDDSGFLGIGSGNIYEEELLRRIVKTKELNQKIKEAQKLEPESSGGLF